MHTQQHITSTRNTGSGAGSVAFGGIACGVRMVSTSPISISIIRIIKGR